MTAASSATISSTTPPANPGSSTPPASRARSPRGALMRKEWRENLPALLVGLLIYVGLPVLWTTLYRAIDLRGEAFPGIATALLFVSGWLFSAVLAAQCVCRDFGQRQGEFLTALPVTLGNILSAKALAASAVILIVLVLVAVWDGFLYAAFPPAKWAEVDLRLLIIGAFTLPIVSFWFAFVLAVLTRRTLTSVLFTTLALVVLLTLPWISAWATAVLEWARWAARDEWQRFHLHEPLYDPYAVWRISSLVAACLIIALGAIAQIVFVRDAARDSTRQFIFLWAAYLGLFLLVSQLVAPETPLGLIASGAIALAVYAGYPAAQALIDRERPVRLGNRLIASTFGLTAVAVCVLALYEVGATVRVDDLVWISHNPERGIAAGRRALAIDCGGFVNVYSVNEQGRIAATHRIEFSADRLFPDVTGYPA